MPTPLEQIKEKIDIVDFIGSYIKLLPAGKNFKALCPFHQEKTPSFIVSPERQIWHCFGSCGEGGDIVKFLMKYENLEFYEALRVLAEKAGIELQRFSLQDQKEFDLLYEINEKAKDFFKASLAKFPAVQNYLKNRALTQETIKEFEIGFAPGGESLTLYLLNLRYNINELVKTGLSVKTEKGTCIDRFRGRIIFPIYNTFNKIVGFTGRLLPEQEKISEAGKYLNSPDSLIFNKSRILYGLHKSKSEISRSRTAFLVEGQMDFLLAWQSGIKNTAAVSGTALSREHLKTLKRFADNLTVSFDKDEAGVKALERLLDIFENFDFNIKIIDLNGYKDPAEAAEKNPDFLQKAINQTQSAFSGLFEFYLNNVQDWPAKKRNIRHLLKKIKNIKSSLEQSHWLKELSLKADVDEKILAKEMENIKLDPSGVSQEKINEAETNKISRWELICQRIFSLVFMKPDFAVSLNQNRHYLPGAWQKLLDIPDWQKNKEIPLISFLDLRSSHEFSDADSAALEKEFEELTKQLEIESKKNERSHLYPLIKSAQEKKDEDLLKESLKEFHNISKEINNLQK